MHHGIVLKRTIQYIKTPYSADDMDLSYADSYTSEFVKVLAPLLSSSSLASFLLSVKFTSPCALRISFLHDFYYCLAYLFALHPVIDHPHPPLLGSSSRPRHL
jgi:hypothetical protein